MLPIFLSGCSKQQAPPQIDADGIAGGDASTMMRSAISRLSSTSQEISYTDYSFLCEVQAASCATGTCEQLNSAKPAQKKLARKFIQETRSDAFTWLGVDPKRLFSFITGLLLNGQPVIGSTPLGEDGYPDAFIHFDDAKVLALRPDQVDMYLYHEIGHKVNAPLTLQYDKTLSTSSASLEDYIADDQLLSVGLAGRDFLNLVGACMGRYSLSYRAAVLADAPIGYWRLEDPSGAAHASDSSGHAYDGVFQGAAWMALWSRTPQSVPAS